MLCSPRRRPRSKGFSCLALESLEDRRLMSTAPWPRLAPLVRAWMAAEIAPFWRPAVAQVAFSPLRTTVPVPTSAAAAGMRVAPAQLIATPVAPPAIARPALRPSTSTVPGTSAPRQASPAAATVAFVGSDTTTQGNWTASYGGDGYEVIGGITALPSYASVTPAGQSNWTWATNTADIRAPLASVTASSRVAACWCSGSSFTVDVNLTDGQTHKVSLYALNWDGAGRPEQVDVLDAASGTVLDSETLTSFQNGTYLSWNISGHVVVRITNNGYPSAVVSGLFFGGTARTTPPPPPSSTATFVGSDTTTQGNWTASYGGDGYEVIGGTTALPSYASVTPAGQSNWTWAASTADIRAPLASATASSRVAACWYSGSSFTVDVNLTDGQTHKVSLYALNWDGAGRPEQVDVLDAASGTVLDSETLTSFQNGTYLSWNISGHVVVHITNNGYPSAVVSGLFFGGTARTTPPPSSSTVAFVGSDTTTQGNWTASYGGDGYEVIGGITALPSYASVTPAGQSNWTWATNTADIRAPLASVTASSRVAACWYSGSSFTVDVNLTDGQTHKVSLYALNWDGAGRPEQVDVLDAASGTVLDSETLTSFQNGTYLSWNISGHVVVRITNNGYPSAVVSGLFFGGTARTTPPPPPSSTASFRGERHDDPGQLDGLLRRRRLRGRRRHHRAALLCQRHPRRTIQLDLGRQHRRHPRPALVRHRLQPRVRLLV